MNNQKTVSINLASIFHRRKIISLFFFPDVCCGCHIIPRCLDAIYHILPDHFHQGSKYTSRLIPCCASSVCQNLHLLQSRHLRHCQQKIQDCHPKDNSLREEREWFGLYTHAKGAMKANIIQKQEHAKAYFVSHCWTHAQWWICLLLSIPFHFVSMKRKPIWVSKPHYCIQCYILGGTASLISFVLPFSDNHFSNKKIYCSHSQIFRGFLHFLEIYPEIPNMFNVNFMKWRYIMRYLSITVERFTGVDSMPLV